MDAETGAFACLSPEEMAAYEGVEAMQRIVHETAVNAGWHLDRKTGIPFERNFGEVIALCHSELSEALEAHRKGNGRDDKLPWHDAMTVELADAVIRIFDIAGARKLNLAAAILDKNKFNKTRADHQLANRNAVGGKAY
ncbi:hypothetical protein NKJ28_00350 [Mesorhizobium sp. M0145]|uniref:hypothetical protein n=1 Tax=Mesorhizobium sp. M0145 TaxID=2956895 RepID=UPI00333CC7A9